jgi:hypothetical protein
MAIRSSQPPVATCSDFAAPAGKGSPDSTATDQPKGKRTNCHAFFKYDGDHEQGQEIPGNFASMPIKLFVRKKGKKGERK